MENEAYQATNNHSDKTDEMPVDSTAMPADLKTEDTPAAGVAAEVTTEAVMMEDTDSFEIPIEPENGDGAVLEMISAGPAPAGAALGTD
ncbi:MAG: hypothetical protein ACRENG_05490, partial [bacterium]